MFRARNSGLPVTPGSLFLGQERCLSVWVGDQRASVADHPHPLLLGVGAPAFLAHVPILGSALRGICVRAVKRMVEVRRHTLRVPLSESEQAFNACAKNVAAAKGALPRASCQAG